MGINNVLQTGKSGMTSAKAGIATSGHNIANANTEGFSRQRVQTEAITTQQASGLSNGGLHVGEGSKISRVERINDGYLEKQLREGTRDTAYHEEKQVFLNQVEDVFNEMNGDGLNRIVAKFYNDFRKLSNDPTSEAIRQSVRESSQAMVNDFKRLRGEVEAVRSHIDNRIDGSMKELNVAAKELAELNGKIRLAEVQGNEANDLRDRRDGIIKKINTFVDVNAHPDNQGNIDVEIKGVGPLVTGVNVEDFSVHRAPSQADQGNVDGSLQISRSSLGNNYITGQFQGGKIGALIETRDQAISGVLERLDQLAYSISSSVNEIHEKGFTQDGRTGVAFFKPVNTRTGAAGQLALSDDVHGSVANIATALQPDAPGDNRNSLAIANLQNIHLMNNGKTTVDDFYNSIVSDIGVSSARNREAVGQQASIMTQLQKMRDQVSGVSIDEETTNLMQYQHAFDASARVIKVADEMMDTVLKLRG
jgi:flagellar hook-associated protein 1 FlgK